MAKELEVDELKKGLDLLGIAPKDWNSSTEDEKRSLLRKEYLKKSRLWHPDKTGNLPQKERDQLTEQFKIINNCYGEMDRAVKMSVGVKTSPAPKEAASTKPPPPPASPPPRAASSAFRNATSMKDSTTFKNQTSPKQEQTADNKKNAVELSSRQYNGYRSSSLLTRIMHLKEDIRSLNSYSAIVSLGRSVCEKMQKDKLVELKGALEDLRSRNFESREDPTIRVQKIQKVETILEEFKSMENKSRSAESGPKETNKEYQSILERIINGIKELLSLFQKEPVVAQTKPLSNDIKTKLSSMPDNKPEAETKNEETPRTNRL